MRKVAKNSQQKTGICATFAAKIADETTLLHFIAA